MPYEEVDYWPEMLKYFNWADSHVFSTLHFCWAAQAGLYRDYGVEKRILPRKLFGIYQYNLTLAYHPLLRGFDDRYFIPQSRHTSIDDKKVDATPELTVLSRSEETASTSFPTRNPAAFSCWAILNTTYAPWNGSTSGIGKRDFPSVCRKITIPTMIPRKSPVSYGAAMPICSTITG